MSKAPQETLENLHSQVAQELLQRIISGEASSADMSNAIRVLKLKRYTNGMPFLFPFVTERSEHNIRYSNVHTTVRTDIRLQELPFCSLGTLKFTRANSCTI